MDRKNGAFVVAEVVSDGKIVVRKQDFVTTLPDETKIDDIQIEKTPDGWHLVISGTTKDGKPSNTYSPVDFMPDGTLQLRVGDDAMAVSDTCTGNPCTRCAFLHGACSCTGTGTVCNHSHTQALPETLKMITPFD